MPNTKTHQHESRHGEHVRDHEKYPRDEQGGAHHGHGHQHRHYRRRWFKFNAEQRDIIILILGGIIALVFVLLFVF